MEEDQIIRYRKIGRKLIVITTYEKKDTHDCNRPITQELVSKHVVIKNF